MNNIKKARIAAGVSQKYVAVTLGVACPSVSNWESGKTKPTPEKLAALADLLGVTTDYLLGRDETQKTLRLREERIARGYTQQQIADHVGCSTVAYSRYETGARAPSLETLDKIACFFGITVDDLFRSENETDTKNASSFPENEAREKLVSLLMDYTPEELQRIMDFAAGVKMSRK